MSNDLADFEEFMKRREKAAKAYVSGDAEPLAEISANASPATFFSPKGGYRQGSEEVLSTYKNNDVAAFEKGSESNFEILQMAANDGIAYWIGFQRAKVQMKGQAEPVPFNLRLTEIFRREGNDWKMVHRHADPLKHE